jgi:competence protein ComEC
VALAQALRCEPHGGAALAAAHEGRIEVVRAGEGALLARLEGTRGPLLELPRGAARSGEGVRLLGAPASSQPGAAPRRVAADELQRLAPARGWERWRARLHARCERFDSSWSRALAAALLLGERDGLDAAQTDLFARVGLAHLLAVSGMQVSLVAALLLLPLAELAARRGARRGADGERLRLVWIAGGLLAYAALAGGDAPVRRAAIVGVLACLATSVDAARGGRARDGLSLWGAALAVELACDPRALEDLGLQLSYAAVLALILGARGIDRALAGDAAGMADAGAGARGLARLPRILAARCLRMSRLSLAASLAAVVGTLPLSAEHFGEWSPVGILATPPAVAITTAMLLCGWIAILLPGAPLAGLFEVLGQALAWLAQTADAWPGTPHALPERPLALGLLAAGAGLLAVRAGSTRRVARIACASAALWLLPWSPSPAALEVVALDVGHGTAVLLRAPGAGTWVFDAGSRDTSFVGRSILRPQLARLDGPAPRVALSHADRDHLSGLGWLIERHPPAAWWGALPAPLDERLAHATPTLDLPRGACGERFPGGARATLLRGLPQQGNEGSRALAFTWAGRSVLLCGDAEDDGLAELLALWRPQEPLDLLLWPHHGAASPWTAEVLEAWRPREVWISAAAPPALVEELDRRGIPWRCTAVEGALRAVLPAVRGSGTEAAIRGPTRIAARTEDAGSSQDAGGGPVVRRRSRREPQGLERRTGLPGPLAGPGSPSHRAEGSPLSTARPASPMLEHAMAKLTAIRLVVVQGLFASALAASSAFAQEPAPLPEATDEAEARATRQLLHLADGRVLRVRARPVGEGWEVHGREGWQTLPEGTVLRAKSEREVLAQSRELARAAGRGDAQKRVALADWMLREGLAQEALAELDGVLTQDPDEASALALLAAPPQALRVGGLDGDDSAQIVREAAGSTPCVRELALRRLAELEEPDALRARLTAALDASSARIRAFAALGLRRLFPGEGAQSLMTRAVLDGSEDVRHQAALSLGAVGDEAVVLPIARALGSSHASVRSNAAEALGAMGYPAAVPVLVSHLAALQSGGNSQPPRSHIFVGRQFAYVQDYDVEVAQNVAVGDPQIGVLVEGSVLDVRVIGVTVTTALEAGRVRRALANLTGEEKSTRGWLAWWDERKADFERGAPTAPVTRGG